MASPPYPSSVGDPPWVSSAGAMTVGEGGGSGDDSERAAGAKAKAKAAGPMILLLVIISVSVLVGPPPPPTACAFSSVPTLPPRRLDHRGDLRSGDEDGALDGTRQFFSSRGMMVAVVPSSCGFVGTGGSRRGVIVRRPACRSSALHLRSASESAGISGRRVCGIVGGCGCGCDDGFIPWTSKSTSLTMLMMMPPPPPSSGEAGGADAGAASVEDSVTVAAGRIDECEAGSSSANDGGGGDRLALAQQPSQTTAGEPEPIARPSGNGQDEDGDGGERLRGTLVLLTVPLAWGTYAPAVRYVYALDPPVPGLVFSAGYYLVASAALLGLLLLGPGDGDGDGGPGPTAGEESSIAPSTTARSSSAAPKMSLPPQVLGGLELGSYLFVANCLQVLGLKSVPADRAAFLVQLTTVMVPVLSAVMHAGGGDGDGDDPAGKEKRGIFDVVPALTWLACLVAFAGVVVMGLDGRAEAGADPLLMPQSSDRFPPLLLDGGDALVVASAVLYSLHVVRLGRYAPRTSPLALAASKAAVEAVLSVALVAALYYLGTAANGHVASSLFAPVQELGVEVARFTRDFSSTSIPPSSWIPAAMACLWTGLVTCAYTIYAQSYGQARVSEPADANLIYTAQPLFSAAFAYGLLGERLGPSGWVGGGLIASAVWLVTAAESGWSHADGDASAGSSRMPASEDEGGDRCTD